jgi:hypothetical protein
MSRTMVPLLVLSRYFPITSDRDLTVEHASVLDREGFETNWRASLIGECDVVEQRHIRCRKEAAGRSVIVARPHGNVLRRSLLAHSSSCIFVRREAKQSLCPCRSGYDTGRCARTIASAQSAATDCEKAAGGKMPFEVASVKRDTSGQFVPPNFSLDPGRMK